MQIWVIFGRSCNGRRCWYFKGHFVYLRPNFMSIWYILWSFGLFFPVLVSCTEKNKATLVVGSCKCSSRRIGSTGTKLKEMGG
jgi:hypothetical protein